MIYKSYGNTGKQVSAVGFGGMRFQKEDYANGPEKAAELVLRAAEMGINYFDTAPGYCDDKSEIICGEAFRQMKADSFYVSTKCGLWNAKTADEARRMVEQSLKRLHVPRITFYNMWCIKTLDEYREMTKPGGIFDGILKAHQEGLIEHICCSTHAAGGEIEQIVADGKVAGVTLGYNAINFAYRRQGIAACHKQGVGVVTMNPLGGGIIPENPKLFDFIRGGSDHSLVVAALRFIIGQQEVSVALPGIANVVQLQECVSAADKVATVTAETLEAMSKHLSSELNTLCTGCAYCDECPVEIPIPRMMDAYNQAILDGGEMKGAIGRLGGHWGLKAEQAKDCISCGRCEGLCTQKLPIMARLAEIAGQA